MTEQRRAVNPIADGIDLLFGTGEAAQAREAERRARLTKWQRRREDATSVAIVFGAVGGGCVVAFGPWLVGAYCITRWIVGGRS